MGTLNDDEHFMALAIAEAAKGDARPGAAKLDA
jgi:hypothetical protein